MSITTYEDPAKTNLRQATEVAIDQAGLQLVGTKVKVTLEKVPDLRGNLVGDIQSLNAQEERTFYFVRPGNADTLPKWLTNYARASHVVREGSLYVVVREYTQKFEAACRAAGAGLLRLTDDEELEEVVSYDSLVPAGSPAAVSEELSQLRRRMEGTTALRQSEHESRYARVSDLVAGMDGTSGDKYIEKMERSLRAVHDWSYEVSTMLDEAELEPTEGRLSQIRELVKAGPRDPFDEDEGVL